jgi:hypothetical protein
MRIFLLAVFNLFFVNISTAQENPNSALSKGIKYHLSDNSIISFRFGTQVWARYMQTNPGSKDVNGHEINTLFDIGLRRTRFAIYSGFLNDKFVAYTQLGMNNQSFSGKRSPQIYFHDVWSAFQLFDGGLYIGMGLHGWAGVSRLNSASYATAMMLDAPGFNIPNLSKTDQAGRQLGVFFKGNAGKFNYRFAVNKPFTQDERSNIALHQSIYYPNSRESFTGYVFYSFLDKEKFKSSYVSTSYLGKKKILNMGAGYDIHPQSLASLNAAGDTSFHDKKLFGVDVFWDYPFKNSSVLTVYSVAYFHDFGPNYVRSLGTMNPISTGSVPQGGGNAEYKIGTGNIYYTALGYILPDNWQPLPGRFQPTLAIQYKNFEGLAESSTQFDIGLNYYISGHNAKLTLQYSNWPVYGGSPGYQSTATILQKKNLLIFQVQMFL